MKDTSHRFVTIEWNLLQLRKRKVKLTVPNQNMDTCSFDFSLTHKHNTIKLIERISS